MSNVSSLASDGAAVMTDAVGGVAALLKRYNPVMITIHCVAHRLALAAGQAMKKVVVFSEYQKTLKMVYRFNHDSAVR